MYLGHIVELANYDQLYEKRYHPYTEALLSAVPVADPDFEAGHIVSPMQGELTSPINPKPGCRFAGRCPYADERCRSCTPELKNIGGDHAVACWKV